MNKSIVKIIFIVLLCTVLCFAGYAKDKASPGDKKTLEQKVDEIFAPLNEPGSPGSAVAIIKDGKVIYKKGFGTANLDYDVPITPSTIFNIGSASKQFTAMAITILEEQGKLSADDDICKYLPEMPDYREKIAIRHLLHHTSGLRHMHDLMGIAGWREGDVLTRDNILEIVRRQIEINFTPGVRYQYCNTGYLLLAEIVSRVTGKSFGMWTRENIFKPLGMNSTYFQENHQMIVKKRATPYGGDDKKNLCHHKTNVTGDGAGGVYSTVEDLAKWIINFEEKKVGGPEVIKRMFTCGKLNNGKRQFYARGLMKWKIKGHDAIFHGGKNPGYCAALYYIPAERFGVIVLSNFTYIRAERPANQIVGIYLPVSEAKKFLPKKPQVPKTEPKKPPKPVKLTTSQMAAFTGNIWLTERMEGRKILLEEGKLYYAYPGNIFRFPLEPISEKELVSMKSPECRILFQEKGKVVITNFEYQFPGEEKNFQNGIHYRPDQLAGINLEEYTGLYYSQELNIVYQFALRDGKLYVHFRNADKNPLMIVKKDFVSCISGEPPPRYQFLRDKEGAITGFGVYYNRLNGFPFTRLRQ